MKQLEDGMFYDETKSIPWIKGYNAYHLHFTKDANPYQETTKPHNEWLEGFLKADNDSTPDNGDLTQEQFDALVFQLHDALGGDNSHFKAAGRLDAISRRLTQMALYFCSHAGAHIFSSARNIDEDTNILSLDLKLQAKELKELATELETLFDNIEVSQSESSCE